MGVRSGGSGWLAISINGSGWRLDDECRRPFRGSGHLKFLMQ